MININQSILCQENPLVISVLFVEILGEDEKKKIHL